jgi:uncharacterized protein (PEP-CTERM system associated)
MATTAPTASRSAKRDCARKRQPGQLRSVAASATASVLAILSPAAIGPAHAQRLDLNTGIDVYGIASSNPDLAPRGEEKADIRLVISPTFSVTGSIGERMRVSGGGSLGASASLSLREGASFSTSLRPSGALNGTIEVVDNFFFVDVRAGVQSTLNDPFLATTDPFSPANTSTSYQVGIAPYIKGTLFSEFEYQVRSDNSWTDNAWGDSDYGGQYSATNTVLVERSPRPLGMVFSFQQQLLSSDVEGQDLLKTETARFSLRYALTNNFVIGGRVGAERYNFTLAANDWQRYYGAEMSWRPNERTSLDGYWEDRVFGNSWQLNFSYRRPLMAFNVTSSRLLSNTPQQFLAFPELSNLISLLDSAFATRIPDPVERQRAVVDLLSRTQLPREFLTPSIIYSQNFTIQEVNDARVVYYGRLHTLTFSVFQTTTEYSPGIAEVLPLSNKTKQYGTELNFNQRLTPVMSATASASWRNTENQLDTSQQTTQTQLRFEVSRTLGRRTDLTAGARYQWITSTVSNDANEAAVYFRLSYDFN